MPRFLALATLLVSLLVLPVAASAGGAVCFYDETNGFVYEFPKLKVPKKPDDVVPAVGIAFSEISANAVPVSGAMHRDFNTGKLYLGFTRYGDRCLLFAVLEENLSGTISSDCNLDDTNDGTVTLTNVICENFGL